MMGEVAITQLIRIQAKVLGSRTVIARTVGDRIALSEADNTGGVNG
jgi:hypothetical protein